MTTLMPTSQKVANRERTGLRFLPFLALGSDLTLVSLTVAAAALGREQVWLPGGALDVTASLTIAGPAMIVGWIVTTFLFGGYRPRVFGAGLDEYKRVINASLTNAALIGIACYLLRYPLSRGFFILAFAIGIPALVLGRFLLRRGLHRARSRGSLQYRVIIAGTEGHVDEIASVLGRETWLGYDVIGAATPSPGGKAATGSGIPMLGDSKSVADLARETGADVVFLAGGAFDSADDVRALAWELEHEAVHVVIAPGVTDVASERINVRPVGGLPLIHMEKPRSAGAVRRAKRTFDVVGSALLLLVLAPVFAFIALKIRRADGGPVIFKQVRVGRDGGTFDCWKFRTMVPNAEELLAELHAQIGYSGGLFKMEDDPRVTAPGRWLRRFSLDELPQLINVLRGDMSLVGPRPPLEHEVAQYDDAVHRRLRVRPGMTGLWQVSGRSELSWSEAIRLDLYYVDNWSMVQDLTILFRTVGAVLGSRGAY